MSSSRKVHAAQKRGKMIIIVNWIVLDRPGNDLLSRVLRHSIISAEDFNVRVRDGIGFWFLAQVTGPVKNNGKHILSGLKCHVYGHKS